MSDVPRLLILEQTAHYWNGNVDPEVEVNMHKLIVAAHELDIPIYAHDDSNILEMINVRPLRYHEYEIDRPKLIYTGSGDVTMNFAWFCEVFVGEFPKLNSELNDLLRDIICEGSNIMVAGAHVEHNVYRGEHRIRGCVYNSSRLAQIAKNKFDILSESKILLDPLATVTKTGHSLARITPDYVKNGLYEQIRLGQDSSERGFAVVEQVWLPEANLIHY